jgi:2-(acetamidomethylene)succinate hydrolase
MAIQPAERRRKLPGIELCTFESGSDAGPTLVFLHGITANGRVWDPVVERLSGRFRCVAVDQRGHGRSARPTGDVYAAEDYARDVAELIADIGAGPAVVVGHSLGARNAIVAGATYPERVRAVVAIDYVPFLSSEVFDTLDKRVGGGADLMFSDLDEARRSLRARYPNHGPRAIDIRAEQGHFRRSDGRYAPLADPEAIRSTLRGLRADLAPALRAIRVPTLLVRGAESLLVGVPAWAETRAFRPDLEAVVVVGADHYVPEVRPVETADLIAAFVTKLGQAPGSARN